MKKIFFIAVNYNNYKYTLKYIESVNKLALIDNITEIIIVDNASELNDFLKVKNAIQKIGKGNIKLIRNKENLGYFKALNVGIFIKRNSDFTHKRITRTAAASLHIKTHVQNLAILDNIIFPFNAQCAMLFGICKGALL